LLESRLFGHVRGAFSGATRDEIGFVRAAHEGTLFLDEVSSLSAAGQAALLRVLQEEEVVPLGRSHPVRVDLRVIAASPDGLEELVDRGRLREDLVGRLMGYSLKLPPLVERVEDIGIFLGALLEKHGPPGMRLSPAAVRLLCRWRWSRNIRELEQAIRLALATQSDGCIQAGDLPEELACTAPQGSAFECRVPDSMLPPALGDDHRSPKSLENELIAHLRTCGGNISEVARAMRCSRAQIHRWLKRFGLEPATFRPRDSVLPARLGDRRRRTTS
jgi:DNA-binding NtrC family response regulator